MNEGLMSSSNGVGKESIKAEIGTNKGEPFQRLVLFHAAASYALGCYSIFCRPHRRPGRNRHETLLTRFSDARSSRRILA